MKPATQITDRAKRYRANSETSDWPKVCMFCGSTKDLQVDHLDGFEENGEPENLLMLCRSCNQLKSAVYKKAGMGRRTAQFNPTEAVAHHKGFTIYKSGRKFFTSAYPQFLPSGVISKSGSAHTNIKGARGEIDDYKNPARGIDQWRLAVETLRGEGPKKLPPAEASRVIRSTPIARRYQYLDRVMRANPSVPTFEQYSRAVSIHCAGEDPHCGAHDEGGAIIHATPPSVRSEYAQKIADAKARRGTVRRKSEVPF